MTTPSPIDPTQPLARLVSETITIADLVTRPIWSLPSSLSISQAAVAMEAQEFDAVGVHLGAAGASGPTHFVLHRELIAAIDRGIGDTPLEATPDLCKPISSQDCVERSLPVVGLIELFRERERLFVLQGNQVGWIATPADLAAPAFSVAILSYLTLLETGLKEMSRRRLTNEQIESVMSKSQLEKSRNIETDLKRRNVQTEFRDCLFLESWLAVTREHFVSDLGLSKNAFDDIVGPFPNLRNDLAHGRGLFAQPVPVGRTLDRVKRIIDFTHRVWATVQGTAALWDQYAATEVIREDGEVLVGVGASGEWQFNGIVSVLTAWNPGSVPRRLEENEHANKQLGAKLRELGASTSPVVGKSPDSTWFEDSFLTAGLSRNQVAQLAETFAQKAFFEIDAEEIRVIETRTQAVVRTNKRARNA